MAENAQEIPPPVLLSAVVCDMMIFDALTHKATVVGIFDTINALKYPVRHGALSVFCQLTNGRGQVDVLAKIVGIEGDEEELICENSVQTKFVDVRQVQNVLLQFVGLVFPHAGEYRVQVFAGTEFLGERRILCKQIELPGKQEDDS